MYEEFTQAIIEIIPELEKEKGRPPYSIEILQSARKRGLDLVVANRLTIFAHINELCRKDMVFTNKSHQQFSFERFNDEYRKFSEMMETDYAGYELGSDERTLVAKTARTVSLKDLKKVLLSKDMKDYEDNRWMFEGGAKFLDGEDIDGSRIAMVTYPRTGNTFLRKLLQEITGIATGSD